MITEDYVSFETAKLLKEKGFDGDVDLWFDENGNTFFEASYDVMNDWRVRNGHKVYPHPTLQMARKWLIEKYNIHVEVRYFPTPNIYRYVIIHSPATFKNIDSHPQYFNKDEEACEAAIKYCLNNLIKNEDKEEESEIPVPKTVDEAISTLEKILSDEDREYLLENGAISMHNSLGRWIRNEWGLWTGSELKDELMNMNKGLNHPDDMSNYIIEEFIKYWNNKL